MCLHLISGAPTTQHEFQTPNEPSPQKLHHPSCAPSTNATYISARKPNHTKTKPHRQVLIKTHPPKRLPHLRRSLCGAEEIKDWDHAPPDPCTCGLFKHSRPGVLLAGNNGALRVDGRDGSGGASIHSGSTAFGAHVSSYTSMLL